MEEKRVIKQERELIELRHKYKMEELAFQRESERIFHEDELTRIRIKSAEIRKSREAKAYFR
jgi:hypothetical protein